MRRIILSLAIGAASALPLVAQPVSVGTGTEFRTFVGAFLPTGNQHDDFKNGATFGLQAAEELSSYLHVLGSLGFTPASNKFITLSDDRTNIWQYDVGIELNAIQSMANDWLWRPLIGAGVGARTYQYQANNVGSHTCAAGYATAGTEFQRRVVAIRLEARDYVNCFESPISGKKTTRNDVGLSFGLVYHIR